MGITETWSRLIGDLVQVIHGGIRSSSPSSSSSSDQDQDEDQIDNNSIIIDNGKEKKVVVVNDSMSKALITVFGMQNDGKIHKEKARSVVEKLGLIRLNEEAVVVGAHDHHVELDPHDNSNNIGHHQQRSSSSSFELPGDYDYDYDYDYDDDDDDDVEEEEEEVVAVEAVVVLGVEEIMELDYSKQRHLLQQAFEIFDENGNGFIEAEELKRVFDCLGLDCGWNMNDIENMLRVADLNFDGKVDFREFELMMMGLNNNNN